MEYSTRNERKRGFRFGWILLFLSLALVAMAGISVNKIRNGQPGFLTNLWEKGINTEADAYLDGNALTLPIPGYVKTVMLLGSDYQPSIGFRTDVMLLVAMNTKTSEFHLLSFPRDLWVNIPGVGPQRLNTALPFGGTELLSDTLALNFGFRPDNFAMVDFDGFKNIIDVMGGIDVDVEKYMEDECWLNDTGWCVIQPGRQYMTAGDAFWYVRARKNTSDFDRNRRQQEVIKAMVSKALRPTELPNLPRVFNAISNTVETNLKVSDMFLYVVPLSKFFDGPDITSYQITPNEAVPGMTDGGASVLYPDVGAIQAIIRQALWIE
ncbi:MAG: LCP family protein [Chloroflexi bacterium]|nr:LCP family protein [Chloroflexota bacterium]